MENPKQVTNTSERKREERVSAQVPVQVGAARGTTRNISATGILMELDLQPQVGSALEFRIELQTPSGVIQMLCEGEVVRVEDHQNGKQGVAVKILKQEIQTPNRQAANN